MDLKKPITIALGCDHRGYVIAQSLLMHQTIGSITINWINKGTFQAERTDYPLYSDLVCKALLAGEADGGLLLCGTGIGMSIAANRYAGIYAGVAWNAEVARRNKQEDNVNVLVLPTDYCTIQQAYAMVFAWMHAVFKEGRYRERITMIDSFLK